MSAASSVDRRVMRVPQISTTDSDGRPVCAKCGRRLKKSRASDFWHFASEVQPYGWAGNSIFCSIRHAAEWGIDKASVCSDA